MHQYYLYILASRPGGALYVGVTSDLRRRVCEHKEKLVPGHTKRYQIDQLVYFEAYDSATLAIQREKNIKHWPRAWKTNLIGGMNPTWRDLYDEIASRDGRIERSTWIEQHQIALRRHRRACPGDLDCETAVP